MYAKVNGVRLAYSYRGQRHANVLLLIHGFPLDRHMWDSQLRELSSEVGVIVPDLRGHGQSEVPPGPYSMDQHADDLAGLLDHLGVRRVILGGLSMGGYVAFAFWRRHASRVQALILADTRAEADSVVARVNRDAMAARVQEAGVEALVEEMLPRLLAPESLANPRLADQVKAMIRRQKPAGVIAALAGLRDRPDSQPTLSTITVPTLLLAGEADRLTPPEGMMTMAKAIRNAQLVVVPRAGHLSPLENPRAFNSAVRAFLRTLTSG
jgi:3-oxoadipate enol-lactonase